MTLRAAAREMYDHIMAYDDAMGHSYCATQSGEFEDACTCGFTEKQERWAAALATPEIDVERLRQAAMGVVKAQEVLRSAINGQGHTGEDHDRVLHYDQPGEVQIFDTFGDCAACGGSQYGAEDDLARAYGRLRAVLGMDVRPWEYPEAAAEYDRQEKP